MRMLCTLLDGICPRATLTIGRWRRIGLLCLVLAAVIASPAQDEQTSPDVVTFKVLVNYDGGNGNGGGPEVQGTDGNLYGISFGGTNGMGNVLKLTPAGSLTTIYKFCSLPNCTDGSGPADGLVAGTDGNFYGTTSVGGAYSNASQCSPGCGTVFQITPAGTLKTLYSFCAQTNCTDGSVPNALVLGSDGNFYGTTSNGGTSTACSVVGCGTVFMITPQGAFTSLHSFDSTDGEAITAPLMQAADGNFYGVAQVGGAFSYGTVFRITPKGELTTIHSFGAQPNVADGASPWARLVQAANGHLYGVTLNGGANCQISGLTCGTVFEISLAGAFSVLHSFCTQTNCPDGAAPLPGLIQGSDGNFYGTTFVGGTGHNCSPAFFGPGCGTVFQITSSGTLTTLHDFDGTDGGPLIQGIVQGTNGTFYGGTGQGGTSSACSGGCGTIFGLSVGLRPFIETLPTSGKVGDTIQIMGNDLTNATSVNFNGTAAAFTVVSKTLIKATVPAAATTGFVRVSGPNATLKSNVKFRVRP
ncbi:MAG TPA: choice-of-anchor tandem repeat GloVer-containing protein [Bryobacteraceae bacterium]|nr:choice-of-anchor tandem repeat GloVer-containing protein [Bryobacteraceae bacterium]